jgi:beta-N-acetylhexosaminidase
LKKLGFILLLIPICIGLYIWLKPQLPFEDAPSDTSKEVDYPSNEGEEEQEENPSHENNDEIIFEWKDNVDEIIEEMSLDEKIGQMIYVGFEGETFTDEVRKLISTYKVGGIIVYAENLVNPKQSVELINSIKQENKTHIPLFIGVDQEGGRIERLPGNLISLPTSEKIGSLNNPAFAYEIGKVLGKEVGAFGMNMNFAPVLDVNSNPDNPVIGDRSYGNNVEVVSTLGIETWKGMKSEQIIPVIKHFPGHGDTFVDSHLQLPVVKKDWNQLKELELKPFEESIQKGADVVMVAHILFPAIDDIYPASMSKTIITDYLRNELNFDGVVITDDMTMEAITDHFLIDQAAVESVKAGTDIVMVAHDYDKMVSVINALKATVERGEISEERINESVRRIIQLKMNYQLDNNLVEEVNIEKLNNSIKSILNQYIK